MSVLLGSIAVAAVLAADTAPDAPWVQLFQYGGAVTVLTLGVLGFMREWWVAGAVYRRRLDELKLKDAEIERLRTYIEERAIPAIERANFVLEHDDRDPPPRRGTGTRR